MTAIGSLHTFTSTRFRPPAAGHQLHTPDDRQPPLQRLGQRAPPRGPRSSTGRCCLQHSFWFASATTDPPHPEEQTRVARSSSVAASNPTDRNRYDVLFSR